MFQKGNLTSFAHAGGPDVSEVVLVIKQFVSRNKGLIVLVSIL